MGCSALSVPFDLQSHSVHSDGALEPAEVVRLAAQAGIRLLALTDHDTVDGVAEAVAAAGGWDIDVIPATEISSVHEDLQDLHVLGYGIDPADAGLRERLARFREDRERRAWAMADRLRDLGYALDDDALRRRAAAGLPIGRPHLAKAAVDHPANAERLAAEGLTDVTPFLVEYLIDGKAAFVGRTTPTVEEAIAVIHDAGGAAVWAHPYWDVKDRERVEALLDRFAGWGLDGVEAFYVTHTEAETAHLVAVAGRLGLVTTGSADFHGPEHRLFSRFGAFETFGFAPPADLAERLAGTAS